MPARPKRSTTSAVPQGDRADEATPGGESAALLFGSFETKETGSSIAPRRLLAAAELNRLLPPGTPISICKFKELDHAFVVVGTIRPDPLRNRHTTISMA